MSKYFSKLNNENLPEKDTKQSSSLLSPGSSLTASSRSNSCSRNSVIPTSAISKPETTNHHAKSNSNLSESHISHVDSTNLRSNHYAKNPSAVNSNLLVNRHYKSQFDLPICNSTTLPSTTPLLTSNHTLLPTHTTQAPFLMTNPSTMINYPHQTAHLSYQCHHTQPYVPASTSIPIYDRLFPTQYSNLSVNSSNTACLVDPYFKETMNQQELHRRDQEIERLQMKIALLEQMNHSTTTSKSQTANLTDLKLSNLEYETALLRMERNQELSKDEQIDKLESMLNAKEYEIEELIKKHKEEKTQLDDERIKLKVLADFNENELLKEKTDMKQLENENDKLKAKLRECNDYMTRLPTLDEVAKKDKEFADLKLEIEILLKRLSEQEKRCLKAKQYIKEKTNEINELKEKLEITNIEKDKIQSAFELYRNETRDVGELMDKASQLADLKAENEANMKLSNAFKEKLKTAQRQHEKELADLNEKLNQETSLVKALDTKLASKEKELTKLEESVKKISNQNQNLLNENLDLKDRLNTLSAAISPEILKYLYSLFKELNLCTEDLNELVQNCIDMYRGKQIDIHSLLGYSRDSSYASFDVETKENAMLTLIDQKYLLNKTNEIKKCRQKLNDVRRKVSDEYADKVGSNVSCITQ